jgi:hypothetical protein
VLFKIGKSKYQRVVLFAIVTETAVGNRQISRKHSAPIRLVFAQSGSRWCNEKASMARDHGDRLINIAVEELDA